MPSYPKAGRKNELMNSAIATGPGGAMPAAQQPDYIEVNLTLYKSIAGSIASSRNPPNHTMVVTLPRALNLNIIDSADGCGVNVIVKDIELRGWIGSTLSNLLSDQFMSRLICGHFHINLSQGSVAVVDRVTLPMPIESHFTGIYANEESIAGIECTVFRNGYVGLVIRFVIPNDVDENTLLDWIKRPDQLEKLNTVTNLSEIVVSSVSSRRPRRLDAGRLNVIGYYIAHRLDPILKVAFDALGLECIDFSESIDATAEGPWSRWTRPYVGIIFRGVPVDLNKASDPNQDAVPRLIIASGRTTPEFYYEFSEPREYLNEQNRNAYGSGGSVVFVASRGWCVWEGGNQNRVLFRLDVIEMTHFVIMALETSLRRRRKFIYEIQVRGTKGINILNLDISRRWDLSSLVKHFVRRRSFKNVAEIWRIGGLVHDNTLQTTKFIGECYVLAPFDDGTSVLLPHLKTHTARIAAIRYEALKFFHDTDRSARDVLTHYVAGLNSALSYLQSPMYQFTARLYYFTVIACIAIVIGTIAAVLPLVR
jgi:hypothetical protein